MSPCQVRNSSRTAGRSHLPKSRPSGVVVTRIDSGPGPERTFFHSPGMSLSASLQVEKATCVNWKSRGTQCHLPWSLNPTGPECKRDRFEPTCGEAGRRACVCQLGSQTRGSEDGAGSQKSMLARADISGFKFQLCHFLEYDLGKLFNLPAPQFSLLYNGTNGGSCQVRVVVRIK